MNHPMQTTIQHLFQATALEDVPRERLESFVEEYPFFGYGHYLLSRKLRAENSPEFTGTTAKTNLYFSNPFWLEWLLVNAPEAAKPVAGGDFAEESQPEPEEKDIWSTPEMLVEMEDQAEHSPSPATETPAVILPAEEVRLPSAAQELLNSLEEARLLRESLIKMNEDFHTHILPANEPIRDEEPPFVLEEQEQVTAPAAEHLPPIEQHQDTPAPTAEAPVEEHAPAIAPLAEVSAPTAEPVVTTEAPTPAAAASTVTAEPVLTFEPYHTIDYFASQGIRLKLDENPTDQLGKQLKSFTDWLKVMRRLPQKEKEIVPDRVAEQAIQSIAAHSIEGKEVLTETMAEVLAMQGMPERARIVYEKLSLLNPGKSAYFAAKIEQLNSH